MDFAMPHNAITPDSWHLSVSRKFRRGSHRPAHDVCAIWAAPVSFWYSSSSSSRQLSSTRSIARFRIGASYIFDDDSMMPPCSLLSGSSDHLLLVCQRIPPINFHAACWKHDKGHLKIFHLIVRTAVRSLNSYCGAVTPSFPRWSDISSKLASASDLDLWTMSPKKGRAAQCFALKDTRDWTLKT